MNKLAAKVLLQGLFSLPYASAQQANRPQAPSAGAGNGFWGCIQMTAFADSYPDGVIGSRAKVQRTFKQDFDLVLELDAKNTAS